MKLGRSHGGPDALNAIGRHGIARLGFSPATLSGLVLWLDGDQNITLNAGNVSAWGDLSPTGANLQQGTAANQPHYTTNAVDGHAAVTANDANDRVVDLAKPDLSNLAGYTSFIVTSFPTGTELVTRTAEASASIADALEYDGTNIIRFVGGASNTGHYATSSNAWLISEAVFDGSQSTDATKLRVYENGTQKTLTLTAMPTTTGAGCAGYQVGHSAVAGGSVAAVVIYNRVLSASERSQVGKYLGARYAISTTY